MYGNSYGKSKVSIYEEMMAPVLSRSTDEQEKPLDAWGLSDEVDVHYSMNGIINESHILAWDMLNWGIDNQWNFTDTLCTLTKSKQITDDSFATVDLNIRVLMTLAGLRRPDLRDEREEFVELMKAWGDIKITAYHKYGEKIKPWQLKESTHWFYRKFEVYGEYESISVQINLNYAKHLLDGNLVNTSAWVKHRGIAFRYMRWMNMTQVIGERKNGLPMYKNTQYLNELGEVLYNDESAFDSKYIRSNFMRMHRNLNKEGLIAPQKMNYRKGFVTLNKPELARQTKIAAQKKRGKKQ